MFICICFSFVMQKLLWRKKYEVIYVTIMCYEFGTNYKTTWWDACYRRFNLYQKSIIGVTYYYFYSYWLLFYVANLLCFFYNIV